MATRRIAEETLLTGIVPGPATPTAARRRRPSSKAPPIETVPEKRAREAAAARKEERRTAKQRLLGKRNLLHEDKRESAVEFESDALPRNLKAESDNKANHKLEVSNPAKRPSRKSTRGGANHIKPDSQQRRQVTRDVRSPKNRSAMRGG